MLKHLILLSTCLSVSLAFWAPSDARLLDDGEPVPKAWVRDASAEEGEEQQEAQQLFTDEELQEVNETLATFNSANCGIKNGPRDLGLIVGGTEAPANAWPWAVGLLRYGNFICGGTILNERYIITAAHCVSRGGVTGQASNFQVLVGAHTLGSSGQLFNVERVQAHEGYNENLMQNDIALLRLRSSINFASFGKRARPVCLPPPALDSGNRNLVGRMSTVVGWGTTREGGSISRTLQQVQIPIISNAECARKYNSATVREGQICAAYASGGRDSCQGDSGGSLTLADGGKFYQLGVVSWGSGCARPGAPGVYTRVSKQLAWIARNTKQQ